MRLLGEIGNPRNRYALKDIDDIDPEVAKKILYGGQK